jgi:hypothetical protein
VSEIAERWKREQGKIVICRAQDFAGYLDQNRREKAAFQRKRNSNMRKVAEIPLIVVEQWLKMGINVFDKNDNRKVQQLLNSNEYEGLRTSPGKCRVK